jgi:hypothetical protein
VAQSPNLASPTASANLSDDVQILAVERRGVEGEACRLPPRWPVPIVTDGFAVDEPGPLPDESVHVGRVYTSLIACQQGASEE